MKLSATGKASTASPMKQLSVRKVGPVKLTSVSAALYGDPITCPPPWWPF